MAKKRRLHDQKMHEYHLRLAREEEEKKEAREKKRRIKRKGDAAMRDKPKRITFRYRRHMRINGITPQNKKHARELWNAKYGLQSAEVMEIDAEEQAKKRRKVACPVSNPDNEGMDYEAIKVDGMGLEAGIMMGTMTMGSKASLGGR